MASEHEENIFWDLADEFIDLANRRCENAEPSLVSAALLQACARFNAFVVANASVDRKEYTEEIESAQRYLTNQYRDFLRTNLDDYRDNYKVYTREQE